MENGGNTTPRIYGYTFDKEGNFIINPKQAPAVKLIFYLYIEGKTLNEILETLHKEGFKTLNGKDRFSIGTLNGILKNEKYAGDMLLQKTTVSKIGSRDSKLNLTKPKYYVSDNHEPIVDKETFNAVQEIIKNWALVKIVGCFGTDSSQGGKKASESIINYDIRYTNVTLEIDPIDTILISVIAEITNSGTDDLYLSAGDFDL